MVHERQSSSVFPFYLGLQFFGSISLVLRFYLGLQFFWSIVGSQVGCFPFTCAFDFFWAIVGTQILERHENISTRTQLFIPVCLLHFYKIFLCGRPATTLCPFPCGFPATTLQTETTKTLQYLFPFFLFKIQSKNHPKIQPRIQWEKCSIPKINHVHFQSKNQPCISKKKDWKNS